MNTGIERPATPTYYKARLDPMKYEAWLLLVVALSTACGQQRPTPEAMAPEAADTVASPMPSRLTCRGNEPFWNVEIAPERITLATPGSGGPVAVRGRVTPTGVDTLTLEGKTSEGNQNGCGIFHNRETFNISERV